jgi:hypothetical protein
MLRPHRIAIATIGLGLLWTFSAAAGGADLTAISPNQEEYLFDGQYLWSSNSTGGCYKLIMQSDGNLVTYNQYNYALWATNAFGSGNYAVMQTDGNFVVYNYLDSPVWASNTVTSGARNLVRQQTDGNLVVYRVLGPNATELQAAWWSGVVVSDSHIMTCPASQKMSVRKNRNASGFDYSVFNPGQARHSWCGFYCAQDASCVAYTYAPPGTEQAQAVCHLKNGYPTSTTSATGFSYGVKTGS